MFLKTVFNKVTANGDLERINKSSLFRNVSIVTFSMYNNYTHDGTFSACAIMYIYNTMFDASENM